MSFKNAPTPHSHPASLDSASTVAAMAEREVELGTGTLTITDHGTLAACQIVYDIAHKKGLTPIIGLESYFRDDADPLLLEAGYKPNEKGTLAHVFKYGHTTMHFLDQAAYSTAIRLLSKAPIERHGSENKPLFNWQDLEELGAQNVTMGSSCLIGIVGRHLLDRQDPVLARKYYERLRSLVKPGNFFVELMPVNCSTNWQEGVLITTKAANGDSGHLRFYSGKTLLTNIGEIKADALAREFNKKGNEHFELKAIKNRHTWEEISPVALISVHEIVDQNGNKGAFLLNECGPFSPDGDVQLGANRWMLEMATHYGDPIVSSDDSHFATPNEKIVQDVRLAQSGSWRMSESYHRRSSQEAYDYFKNRMGISEKQFESWVDNAYNWASRFKDFKLESKPELPTKFYEPLYELAGVKDSLGYTIELIKRVGRMNWKNPIWVARLTYEIDLLHRNGVIDLLSYFFVDAEVVQLYESQGFLTGPGRGSAAGALLAYLLGITHVDPIRYGLSFDRFLTLDRIKSNKFPDIDQDLPSRELLVGEDGVGGWLKERFGDCVAQISTVTTLKLRSAVLDVARFTMGKVPVEISDLTRKFAMPDMGITDINHVMGYEDSGNWIEGSITYDPALMAYVAQWPDQWEIVKKCLGLGRAQGRHACAYALSNRPIGEFIPLTKISDIACTQFAAPAVEAAGCLKMDFLVITSLVDIGMAIQLIQQRKEMPPKEGAFIDGKAVPFCRLLPTDNGFLDIWDLPEDQSVFADIGTGKTETVFQLSTPGAIQWLRHFGYQKDNGNYVIDSIESLAAFTALDRKGPLDAFVSRPDIDGRHNMLVEYARRARGEAASPDIPAIFNQLLPETYGVMCFQESLQKMYQEITGCSGAEAEEFRGNVAKKKKDKVIAAHPRFLEAATERFGSKEIADQIWSTFNSFGGYGFNKSVDQDTILVTCEQKEKKIKDFAPGDMVFGVNDQGQPIQTEVLALHDHGTLEGFEVTFDDGYQIICSRDHKFLTEQGMVSLEKIAELGLGVLSSARQEVRLGNSMRPSSKKSQKPECPSKDVRTLCEKQEKASTNTGGAPHSLWSESNSHQQDRATSKLLPRMPKSFMEKAQQGGMGLTMRCGDLNTALASDTHGRLPGLPKEKERKHRDTTTASQSTTRTKSGRLQGSHKNFGSPRSPTTESSQFMEMASGKSGTSSSQYRKSLEVSQKQIQDGGMASFVRNTDMGRIPDSLWGGPEASGLRESGSQNLGGGRRVFSFFRAQDIKRCPSGTSETSSSARSDAKRRSDPASGRNANQTSGQLLSKLGWQDEAGLVSMAYSNAPLSSTRGLVLRSIVRVRSVGIRRMYDLEVAHPKHNFLLPNGIITSNSHAVCYVIIAYACAYLKHHYPLEWWTAVLSNAKKDEINEKFWRYVSDKIILPDVTQAHSNFTIVGDKIQAPLSLLHGVGEGAHKELVAGAPFLSIDDLVRKIEAHKQAGSTTKFVASSKTGVRVEKTTKGRSALNSGIIYKLIVSGSMDKLFPAGTPTLQMLEEYELAVLNLENEARANRKPKPKKPKLAPEPIRLEYTNLTQYTRYQLRKSILPAHSESVLKMAIERKHPNVVLHKNLWWHSENGSFSKFANHSGYERMLNANIPNDGGGIRISVAGYVDDVRVFQYGENKSKKACDLSFDLDGLRCKLVRWPDRDTGQLDDGYNEKLKGALLILDLVRFKDGKPFAIEGMEIIQMPLGKEAPEESPEESKE